MSKQKTKCLMVVQKSKQEEANALMESIAGPYAKNTFSVPVIHGAGKVITHYAACWQMTQAQLDAIRKSSRKPVIHLNSGRAKLVSEGYTPNGKIRHGVTL